MTRFSQFSTSHKVIKCTISKNSSDESDENVRFVELEQFKPWCYIMKTKHDFHVHDVTLCLWIDKNEYDMRREIYDRSGLVEPVNRISMMLFDKENDFVHTVHRYTHKEYTEQLEEILLSHISPDIIRADNYETCITEGYCVAKSTNVKEILTGLSRGNI